MKNYPLIAKQYAEKVVSGEIDACLYVRQAGQRHLDDLVRSTHKSYPYWFDDRWEADKNGRIRGSAQRVCEFTRHLSYTKGMWAARGEMFELGGWQTFVTCSVFGWKKGDRRRFRIVYIECPRKQGKTEWSAGIGEYMLVMDGMPDENGIIVPEHGAEVYSGATTEKQAKLVFDAAKIMARKNPDFKKLGVEVMASSITIPERNCKFEPVIGKPGDGASPTLAIVDEYHEHASDELFDTMLTGMGAREQPLMWVITTAGSDTAGPCYALRSDVIRMLDGSMPNDETFGIIYTLDPADDWTSEASLRKANPNYDVSVSGDFLKAQVRDAIQSSRKQNIVKTKHLNIWVGARSAWMNMEAWKRCADPSLTTDQFEGEPCWIGLDLASKIDIASNLRIYKRDGIYYLLGRHYLPEERINDPDKSHYQGWLHDGHLIATDGDVIDYGRIKEDIFTDARDYDIVALGYDPWNATQLATELIAEGINAIEIRQGVRQLSEPMKHLEAMVLAGKLRHDGNPCMTWMMGNVVAKTDANDNIYPRKEREENKIDGAVAAIMAMCMERTQEAITKFIPSGFLVNF
jgi:phage terminase large subunit-like protein